MVDALLECDQTTFKSSFLVASDNIFLQNGKLSETALVENVAQTCAAGFGYLQSLLEEEANHLGFIGAISKTKIFATPSVGEILTTVVNVLGGFENVFLIEGEVKSEETPLLYCQMKIVQQ